MEGIFRSREKARYVRAQTSGDLENVPTDKLQTKPSGHVLPYVGVACLGAILFGYHLAVVNGALEYLARDLGIAKDTVLQGIFISHPFWLPDQTASSSSAERNLYLCV